MFKEIIKVAFGGDKSTNLEWQGPVGRQRAGRQRAWRGGKKDGHSG